ncbi:hypothetical protein [Thiolapillus sp.]
MKYFLLVFFLTAQSCSSYCNDYGYIDFGKSDNIRIIRYSDNGNWQGMKNVERFPSSYVIYINGYKLITETVFERDYPTVSIVVVNDDNKNLFLAAEGGDSCLRISQREGTVEMWWRTSMACKSFYQIKFLIMDEKNNILRGFNHTISLVSNGEKCRIDGI